MKTIILIGLLIISFCITFILSCKKNIKNTIIYGKVIDKTSDKPIVNAQVCVGRCKTGSGFNLNFIGGCIPRCSPDMNIGTSTDNNGKFELSFDSEKNYEYYILAVNNNYFEYSNDADVASEAINNITIKLVPHAYLKLHIKNIYPFNSSDRISVNENLTNGMSLEFYGLVDTTICCIEKTGNIKNDIPYFVNKNNIDCTYVKHEFLPAFDTTLVDILY